MRILIIGLGSIGKKHVYAINNLIPDAEIIALRSETVANNFSNVKNIYNINEITSEYFDFAIISNPTSEHKKTIEQLIPFNIPLFIEKPIYSSTDVIDIIKLIEEKNIFTYVACNLRFLDCIKYIKNTIAKKRINEINAYCGSYLPNWRPETDYRNSYSAIPELGGGVHIDLIHELDYLYWIFGNPIEVKRYFRNKSSLEIRTTDYANYLLEYSSFCANVVLNYYRKDSKRSLELVFDNETWNVDLINNQITCNQITIFSSEQRISDTYKIQMEYFYDCLRNKTTTFNTIFEAFDVLKICLEE